MITFQANIIYSTIKYITWFLKLLDCKFEYIGLFHPKGDLSLNQNQQMCHSVGEKIQGSYTKLFCDKHASLANYRNIEKNNKK